MQDPFPLALPSSLLDIIRPIAVDRLSLSVLPLHIHEIAFFAAFYTWIYYSVSPRISTFLFPGNYPALSARTRLNWDVHVVSLVQSIIVCVLAVYIILRDPTWQGTNWEVRVFGYDGLTGFCQAMAGGYFLWDLVISTKHVEIFGVGMLLHAVCALSVFALGYRPMFNYYGPISLIYEISSPFNNIHWFLDKLNRTGSTMQWINGIVLIATFFLCRLVWGFWHTGLLCYDLWSLQDNGLLTYSMPTWALTSTEPHLLAAAAPRDPNVKFTHYYTAASTARQDPLPAGGREPVSIYIAMVFLISNVLLDCLNVYWINKMVATVRKRFPPPFGTKGRGRSEHGTTTYAGTQDEGKSGTDTKKLR